MHCICYKINPMAIIVAKTNHDKTDDQVHDCIVRIHRDISWTTSHGLINRVSVSSRRSIFKIDACSMTWKEKKEVLLNDIYLSIIISIYLRHRWHHDRQICSIWIDTLTSLIRQPHISESCVSVSRRLVDQCVLPSV
jgi:hypothetical protein